MPQSTPVMTTAADEGIGQTTPGSDHKSISHTPSAHTTPPPSPPSNQVFGPSQPLDNSESRNQAIHVSTATASVTSESSIHFPQPPCLAPTPSELLPIPIAEPPVLTAGQVEPIQALKSPEPQEPTPPLPPRRRRKPLNPVRLDATVPAIHFKFPILFPPTPPLPPPSSTKEKERREDKDDIKTPTSPRPMTPMSSPALVTTDDDDAVTAALAVSGLKRRNSRDETDESSKKRKLQGSTHVQRMEVLHYPLLLPHIIHKQQAGFPAITNSSSSYSTQSYGHTSSSKSQRRPLGGPTDDRLLLVDGRRTGSDTGIRGKRKNGKEAGKRRGRSLTPDRAKVRITAKTISKVNGNHSIPNSLLPSYSGPSMQQLSASYPGPSTSSSGSKQNETIVRFGQVLQRVCKCCGATKSPQGTWRTGWVDTVVLCNGCGLRYKNTKVYCKKCSYIPTKGELASGKATDCKKCGEPLTRVVPG